MNLSLEVCRLLRDADGPMTAPDLAEALGVQAGPVYGSLHHLQTKGLAERVGGWTYCGRHVDERYVGALKALTDGAGRPVTTAAVAKALSCEYGSDVGVHKAAGELARLCDLGLVERSVHGRRVYWEAAEWRRTITP